MRILVLGGTHHVGRAVVEEALARGDEVTTVTRGVSGTPAAGADARYADRTNPDALARALGGDSWDAVIDTWSSAPRVVRDSARLLNGRVQHYGYVSSRSVYRWPMAPGADEGAPVVSADPDSTDAADYAAAKRGAELAVLREFGTTSLLARAGLILGPYEGVGRLPFWLDRIGRGGVQVVPGPPDLALQYVDGRDLARWMLACATAGTTGVFDAVSVPGHATIGQLFDACVEQTDAGSELHWLSPDQVAAAGLGGWTDLPIWVPPDSELIGLHTGDTAKAAAAGLLCRPVADTVRDTWARMRSPGTVVAARHDVGFDADGEARLLAQAGR